jgi:hypothetical protein
LFKWAGGQEDKYFARITKNAIKVYEAPDMMLLDKKDLKLEGVLVRGVGGGGAGVCSCIQTVAEGLSSSASLSQKPFPFGVGAGVELACSQQQGESWGEGRVGTTSSWREFLGGLQSGVSSCCIL